MRGSGLTRRLMQGLGIAMVAVVAIVGLLVRGNRIVEIRAAATAAVRGCTRLSARRAVERRWLAG